MVENPHDLPAFPQVIPDSFQVANPGMDLRDWFAGRAIGAIIAATSAGQHQAGNGYNDDRPIYDRLASDAYRIADAMLAERAK